MIIAANIIFGINLEGVSKEAIIPKLESLKYTTIMHTKTLGEKDIDPNYIMCQTLLPDVTSIGGIMSMIYTIDGIKRVILMQIELIPIPRSILSRY
jgi:hypothetical protein